MIVIMTSRACGPCFTLTTRTYGVCSECREPRLLPGPPTNIHGTSCAVCAGINVDFRCTQCGREGEFYRRRICGRCALHNDLSDILLIGAADQERMTTLREALRSAGRLERILAWKGSSKVLSAAGNA